MTQMSPNYNITAAPWEDGEDIITINGRFIGMTVSRKDGPVVVRWLERGGLNDLLDFNPHPGVAP